jgi:hypothetical protein
MGPSVHFEERPFREIPLQETLRQGFDFLWLGLVCRTYSSLAQSTHGRTKEHPLGKSDAAKDANEDLKVWTEHARLAPPEPRSALMHPRPGSQHAYELIKRILEINPDFTFGIENPWAMMRHHPVVTTMVNEFGAKLIKTTMCHHGAIYKKKTMILTTNPGLIREYLDEHDKPLHYCCKTNPCQ